MIGAFLIFPEWHWPELLFSRFTKFRIFQEAIVNPFIIPLDASLSQIMGNMTVSLFFSFSISMAMMSSLLNDIILNREKV